MIVTKSMVEKVLVRQCEHSQSPEGKLLLAVIHQALVDLDDRTWRSSSLEFFNGPWFGEICDFLGLGVDSAREAIELIDSRVDVAWDKLR